MKEIKLKHAIKIIFCLAWSIFILHEWFSIGHNTEGVIEGAKGLIHALSFWKIGHFFFHNLIINITLLIQFSFFVLSLYGIGRFLAINLFGLKKAPLETFISSSALGYAAGGSVFFAMLALKLLYMPSVLLMLAVFFFFGILSVKKYKPCFQTAIIISKFSGFSFFYKTLCVLAVFSAILAFTAIFTPENGFDPLNYYLAIPNHWLIHHGIADMPSHTYFNLFGFYACIYAPAMAIGGESLAKAANFFPIIPGVIGFTLYFGKKYFGLKTAIFALAIICLTYQFDGLAFTTRSDSMMIMFSLALLAAALKIPRADNNKAKKNKLKFVILAGIFAGAAMAVKATAILMVIPVMIIMFYREAVHQGIMTVKSAKHAAAFLALFTAIASIFVIPWLIKNYIYRGNPFFPFLTDLFGMPDNYDANLLFFFKQSSNIYMHEKMRFLKNFISIFFMKDLINNHFMSPIILILPAFLFFKGKKFYKKYLFILFFSFSSLILMVNSFSTARYFFPVYILLVLFLAYYVKDYIEKKHALKTAFVMLLLVFWLPAFSIADFSTVKGQNTIEGYMDKSMHGQFYLYAEWANKNLPENSLIINEDYLGRSAYLRVPCYVSSVFDKNFFETMFSSEDSPEKMLKTLHEKGFTHFLANGTKGYIMKETLAYRKMNGDAALYERIREFTSKYLREIYRAEPDYFGRITSIYEIDYSTID